MNWSVMNFLGSGFSLRVPARAPGRARLGLRAAAYPRQAQGRLRGQRAGSPSSRASLFSGLVRCGVCGGGMTLVSGSPRREHRRFGCGFHREKGPRVCPNGLTVKVGTVESRLVAAIQEHVLHPEAVRYLIAVVNRHLGAFQASREEECRRIDADLRQVEAE